jgi:hypothetical protein
MGFKNARCGNPIPDAYGYTWPPYELCCKRLANHGGRCRVVFRDGGVREWNRGDYESVLTKKAGL